MGKEAALWQLVKKHFSPFSGVNLTRIENRDTGPGVPDVHVMDNGVEYWLELKATETPMGEEIIFKRGGMRPSQIGWINRHLACGGHAFILAQIGPSIFAVSGTNAEAFNRWSLNDFIASSFKILDCHDNSAWVVLRGIIMRSCHA